MNIQGTIWGATLSSLAPAIGQVHNFTANTIDLQQIKYHHRSRPESILVDGNNFILADFGLSRFKNTSQNSDTVHKQGQGGYNASECENIAADYNKHRIRRPSHAVEERLAGLDNKYAKS